MLGIVVGRSVEKLFQEIREHFGTTLQDVIEAIVKKNELEHIKIYLEVVYPELENLGLREVHSDRELIRFVRQNFFFTDIHMLKRLAERFAKEIPEVKDLLAKFEEARDELYEQVLAKDFVKEVKERLRASHAKVILWFVIGGHGYSRDSGKWGSSINVVTC